MRLGLPILRRPVAAALATRGAGSVIQLALSIAAARIVGVAPFGLFITYVSWTTVFGTCLTLGLPAYVLRTIAAAPVEHRAVMARPLILKSVISIFVLGVALNVPVMIFARTITTAVNLDIAYSELLRVSMASAVFYAALRVLAEVLKGLGRSTAALTVEFVLVPSGVVLALVALRVTQGRTSGEELRLIYLSMLIGASVLGLILVWRTTMSTQPVISTRVEVRALPSLWLIALGNVLLTALPYLVLPHLLAAEAIGIFAVAHKLVALSATILVALAAVFDPIFAEKAASGDQRSLFRAFRRGQFWSIAAYAPLCAMYLTFPDEVLSLFGPGFAGASTVLAILALGRLVHACGGLTERFLIMSNRSEIELVSTTVAVAAFLFASIPMVHVWGLTGAAFAYATAFALRSLISYAVIETTRADAGEGCVGRA